MAAAADPLGVDGDVAWDDFLLGAHRGRREPVTPLSASWLAQRQVQEGHHEHVTGYLVMPERLESELDFREDAQFVTVPFRQPRVKVRSIWSGTRTSPARYRSARSAYGTFPLRRRLPAPTPTGPTPESEMPAPPPRPPGRGGSPREPGRPAPPPRSGSTPPPRPRRDSVSRPVGSTATEPRPAQRRRTAIVIGAAAVAVVLVVHRRRSSLPAAAGSPPRRPQAIPTPAATASPTASATPTPTPTATPTPTPNSRAPGR